jgi:hypothetical protein
MSDLSNQPRNKDKIFRFSSFADKGTTKHPRLDDHHASAALIDEPIELGITSQAIGHELDFTWLAVKQNSVTFSDFFTGLVIAGAR